MNAAEHVVARDALVTCLRDSLRTDDRFVAAWLGGSLGRGDADAWSDIDIWLVVADEACPTLCARPDGLSPTLSPERATLVTQFGEVAVEGENSINAGPDGVAMNIVYRDPLVVMDWYLMPAATVRRPASTRLLFDHVGIPAADPVGAGPEADRAKAAALEVVLFWYFVVTTVKAIRRRDDVQVQILLQRMRQCVWKAERLAAGKSAEHVRERGAPLVTTETEQIAALRSACVGMLEVMPRVAAIGGAIPRDPMLWVADLLD